MEITEILISELIPADYNPRKLSAKQSGDIEKSLLKFGFVDPVIVNQNIGRKNVIIGGHQRCKVWEKMGNSTVPAVFVDLNEKEERELNVRLNKNSGEFDFELLDEFFEQNELVDWGFDVETDENEGQDDHGTSHPPEKLKSLSIEFNENDHHDAKRYIKILKGNGAYFGGLICQLLKDKAEQLQDIDLKQ